MSYRPECVANAALGCQHGPGELAYMETIAAGMVPCRVITLDATGLAARVLVKVTAQRGPYRHGETVSMSPAVVVPRGHVRRSGYHLRVLDGWRWRNGPQALATR